MADALEPLKGLLHRVRGAVARRRLLAEETGLRVLHDPENAEIDIVAIHGLGGHGFRSWVSADPNIRGKPKPWLEELLAADMPNARIMAYGYISDGVSYRYVVRNIVYGRALDLARSLAYRRTQDGSAHTRPLFFIAHSLAGWIVKRALIISGEAVDPELKDLELSTCGVAFFGTLSPGRPSSPAPLAHVLRRTTSGMSDKPVSSSWKKGTGSGDDQMQPQASDLEWLTSQMDAFKAISSDLPLLSFYETMKSEDGFIVEKSHSIAGSDGSQIGLKATHSDLVRFRGRDENYKKFIDNFRQMVDDARSSKLFQSKRKAHDMATVHHLEYLTNGFSIPYKLPDTAPTIVPRQDLLDRLDNLLNPATSTLKLSIANLWGLSGTGKSTLARHYAELNKDKLSFVFWIRAESWETVVASYLEFANSLVEHYSTSAKREQVESDLGLVGVQDMLKVKSFIELDTPRIRSVVRAIKNWFLRPDNRDWLLVFDNVESSYDIFNFVPLALSGKVIFTSRDSNCCSWGTKLHVDAMTEQEAIDLLESTLGKTALEDPVQREAASRVIRQLGYHPQNISLAASTMRNKALDVLEYYDRVEAKLPLSVLGSTMDQSPVTRTVLRISAMLSDSMIPVALLTVSSLKTVPARFVKVFAEMKGKPLDASRSRAKLTDQAFQDDHIDDILQYLLDHNFIQTPSESTDSNSASSPSSQSSTSFDSFVVDPAARDHVRDSMTPEEKFDHAWLACNVCVDGIQRRESASSTIHEIHEFARVMAPHAKTCYTDWSGVLEGADDDVDGNEEVAWHVLGKVCMTQGATEQAIGCFELSLRHASRLDAMERTQTALLLAALLQQTGQHRRSSEVLAGIDINLESIDKALGFRVALARASAAAAQGKLDHAGSQYASLEYQQEDELGPTDMATVSTVQSLAEIMTRLGKREDAMALYRRVHLSYQKTLGESHPMTLHALESLARVAKDALALDEAEAMYAQSIDIKTRTLGADHPAIAYPLQSLAVIDDIRKRFDDARARYERALAILTPSLGKAHPLYVTTMENLALSCRWRGRSLPPPSSSSRRGTLAQKRDGAGSSRSLSPPSPLRLDDDGSTNNKNNHDDNDDDDGGRRAASFRESERLYIDIIRIQQVARERYTKADVLSTASKLCEMYENEEFWADSRPERGANLRELLRETK
ncbi:tetratricopeptide repeat protein [Purpureocillium lavendulum]|uniref:Tetratricopeptide repeat protein n=1 Tax=Purpureocillium lavendulum TaxID=1247861 RepID=A0AB34FTK3_9HYPO|nr:tetratricopeptide repeat protein [Purpureocillium lavendulum]